MKIFIINPNTNRKFTEIMKREAVKLISPGNGAVYENAPNVPMFINNHIDKILCGPGMLNLLQENEKISMSYSRNQRIFNAGSYNVREKIFSHLNRTERSPYEKALYQKPRF